VLPLDNAIKPKHKEKYGRILLIAMVFVAALYGSFGMMGYLTFGDTALV
jgi:proton-coupled amino acid transporter